MLPFQPADARLPKVSYSAVAVALAYLQRGIGPDSRSPWLDDETPAVEVRLQVYRCGRWRLHVGPHNRDDDARGGWGARALTLACDPLRVAEDLVDEALDTMHLFEEE